VGRAGVRIDRAATPVAGGKYGIRHGPRWRLSQTPITGLSQPLLQPDNYRLLLINSQQSLIYRTPSVYGNNFVQKKIFRFLLQND
jgi:hypothetical protein